MKSQALPGFFCHAFARRLCIVIDEKRTLTIDEQEQIAVIKGL